MAFSLTPTFEQAPYIKALINIGATLDIPTGYFIQGTRGEWVLNGGLGNTCAVVGIGNSFKSTILRYIELSAMNKIFSVLPTSLMSYDTEINIHINHQLKLAARFEYLKNVSLIQNGYWHISDKTTFYANKWYEKVKDFIQNKIDNKKEIFYSTPFVDFDGKSQFKMMVPTFGDIDSFSEFETEDVAKIQDENELGDSGGNTIHMRQGLAKTRFLMDIPNLCGRGNHYMLMTAHVGKEIQMASGPIPQAPTKTLHTLKNGDKIKGVTGKFFFNLATCWQTVNVTPLINQSNKTVEYPKNSDDNTNMDTDLNIVSLRILRNKAGKSGIMQEVIISQSEGLLPELTEFHFIKSNDRFGISGTLQHYNLDLVPDIKLQRTTVRGKIDESPELRRALNISAELLQMKQYGMHLDVWCEPKVLYEDLIKLGYDWKVLLG